jgi:hypothetical protein
VVGRKKPAFCLFGTSVNTASRMESHGVPSMTHLSHAAFVALRRPGASRARHRGSIEVKGLGAMETYLVPGIATGAEAEKLFAAVVARDSETRLSAAAVAARLSASAALTAEEAAAARTRGSHLRAPRGSCEMHISTSELEAELAACRGAEDADAEALADGLARVELRAQAPAAAGRDA